MRSTIVRLLSLFGLLALTLPSAASAQGPCVGEARVFDFFIGEWDVLSRNRPADEGNWYDTGYATDRVYPVVAGCGLVEHWRGDAGGEFLVGFSLRAFNPQTGQWEIAMLWPNAGQPRFGVLQGGFRHNRGEFYSGAVSAEGDTTITRISFSDVTPTTLRWQNGSSNDGGMNWSTNWIMEYSRREPLYQGPLLNGPSVTTLRCPAAEHRGMDFLIGEWAGVTPPDTTDEATLGIRANVSPILDGCGIMERISAVGQESAWEVFRVRTFDTNINRWVEYRLDSRWPVLQRLEADTPPAGMPWVFQSSGDAPEDGDLRVTMTRGTDGTIRWTEERYNVELTTWEAEPEVIYGVRLGAVTSGG